MRWDFPRDAGNWPRRLMQSAWRRVREASATCHGDLADARHREMRRPAGEIFILGFWIRQ